MADPMRECICGVGCMFHPMADGNRGTEFRGLSHYGSMMCSI
ncbi:MAG: hypothetical protein ACOC1Q_03090 [Desulfosalsimonas sp.]